MGIQNFGARPIILRKTKSATQSLAAGTATNVVMETTTENYGFTLASTSLFKPSLSGLYRINAEVAFDPSGGATIADVKRRLVVIFDNTAAANMAGPSCSTPSIPTAGQNTNVLLGGVFPLLSTNDYALRARQDAAAALLVNTDTFLQVEYLGPIYV